MTGLFRWAWDKAKLVYMALTMEEWGEQLRAAANGVISGAGPAVNADQAMRIATVYRCVRVLAESIASLPFLLYRRKGEDRELATKHPLFRILHQRPNPEMTSMQVIELALVYLLLRGNALFRKVRNGAGRLVELWPIPWDQVTVDRAARTSPLLYRIQPTDGSRPEVLRREEVWHIAGLGWDGVTGMSPIRYAREAMGLALATEGHGAGLFRNGARISGIVSHPGVMKDDEFERFKRSWNDAYAGVTNAGKTAFLERGAKFEKVTLTAEEAQFLETRRFQVGEICRIFGVPLHMVFDHDTQPRANMEQASLEFVVYSLRPWLERIEQTAARDLLDPGETDEYFPELLVDGLLRGDFKTRQEGYGLGRTGGWLCPNDVRRLENLNRIPKEKGGDDYLRPANMVVAGVQAPPSDPPEEAAEDKDPAPAAPPAAQGVSPRELALLAAAAGRVARREVEGLRKLAQRGELGPGLAEFYDRLAGFVSEALAVSSGAGARYVATQRATVEQAYSMGSAVLDKLLETMERDLPRRILEEVRDAPVGA